MAIAPTAQGMVAEAQDAAADVGAPSAQPWPSEAAGWFALFAIIYFAVRLAIRHERHQP